MLSLLQNGSHNNDSEKTCQTTACQQVISAVIFNPPTSPPTSPTFTPFSSLNFMSNLKAMAPPIVMNALNQQSFLTRLYRAFIAILRFYCVFIRVFIA